MRKYKIRVNDSTLDHSAIDYTNDILYIPRRILPNSIYNNNKDIRFNQLFLCVIFTLPINKILSTN